jgi:hypothetical protein
VSLKYRISNIGWYNFELLVQTLLKAVIGPGVTSLGGAKDQGRDAEFKGAAAFPTSECQWTGRWIFQVKYIDFEEQGADAARSSLKSTFNKELQSALVRHRGINNYILLTDVPLTTQSRGDLKEVVAACRFKGNFAVVDGKEICQLLDIHTDVRRSYPQLLGLADLDVIVSRDLYARSRAYLLDWQPKLATYVQTEAHTRAMSVLKREHFIVLDGPPEAGKTTIAAALALIHAAEGFEIIDVRSSNDVFRVSDGTETTSKEREKPRLFVADDAIGSVSLVPAWADAWSRDLPGILRTLSNGRLLVWTARRYILEEALATSRLRDAATEFPRPHEVTVEVGKLTLMQKAEMLYNHAKQGNLSIEHRELIRAHAIEITSHPNFSPLRVKELIAVVLKPASDKAEVAPITWQEVENFLKNPGERWIQAFRELSRSEQTLLSAMLDFEGPVVERELRVSYEMRVSKHEGGHLSLDECLTRLDHSFVMVTTSHTGERRVSVQHPSLRDMLLLHLRGDINARRRYISLAGPSGLAGMIGGIAKRAESETAPQHSVTPVGEEEFEIFLERLRSVSQGVLTLREWELLLTACDRLVPRKPRDSSGLSATVVEIWKLMGTPTERVEPADLGLEIFACTWMGRIIRALLDGFSARRTFENSQRFGAEEWVRLLTSFYTLSSYASPPIYPAFTKSLLGNLTKSLDSIRLATLVYGAEPLVAKQWIARATLAEWKEELEADATRLKYEGEGFGDHDDPYEFDEWRSTARKFLAAAADFSRWAIDKPLTGVEELEEILDSAERPYEPEEEPTREIGLPPSGPYWTIPRLFEDL